MKKLLFVMLVVQFILTGCYSSTDTEKQERDKHKWVWHPGDTAISEHDDLNCEYCKQLRRQEVIEIVDSILKSKE